MVFALGWKTWLLVQSPGKFIVARTPTPSHGRIKKLGVRAQRRGHLPRATHRSRGAGVKQQRLSTLWTNAPALTAVGRFRRCDGSSEGRRNLLGDFWLWGGGDWGSGNEYKLAQSRPNQTLRPCAAIANYECVKSNHFCTNAPRLPAIRN